MLIRLTEADKALIHQRICRGGTITDTANAIKIDRRTLARKINAPIKERDAFLLSLIKPDKITRDDYDALYMSDFHIYERKDAYDLRQHYANLLLETYGNAIGDRLKTEAEREADKVRKAAEQKDKRIKQREAERECKRRKREEQEEERQALCEKLYGQSYHRLFAVYSAFQLEYGTQAEIEKGLGGAANKDAREAYRATNGVVIDYEYIAPQTYARFIRGKVSDRKDIIGEIFRLVDYYRVLNNEVPSK